MTDVLHEKPLDLAGASALAALGRLEHQVRSQRAALEAVPPYDALPRGVLALLAAPAVMITHGDIPVSAWPRLAAVVENLGWVQSEILARQERVAVQLCAVRRARRPRPAGRVLDWRS